MTPSAAFTMRCAPNVIGRPPISSCSLAKAIMLPAKLRLPMTAENAIGMTSFTGAWPGRGARRWYSAAATSAAAPPPTPLNSATICGIAVILTLRAPTTPITAPIAIATAIAPKLTIRSSASVATIAMSMPTAAMRLPVRAVAGDESRFRPMMKVTSETR